MGYSLRVKILLRWDIIFMHLFKPSPIIKNEQNSREKYENSNNRY